MDKITSDVSWAMQRTSSGRLMQATKGSSKKLQPEERGLTLADTEGMFLLLGIGFLIAAGALLSEWVGGCTNRCRLILKKRRYDRAEADAEAEIERIAELAANRHDSNSFLPNSSKSPMPSSANLSLGNDNEPHGSNTNSVMSDNLLDPTSKQKSHHRSKSVIDANLNTQTLLELYDGPKRRHSSFVIIDGEIVMESDRNCHSNPNHNNLKVRIVSMEKIDNDDEHLLKVEINRPPTPFIRDVDDVFGENIDENDVE